MCLLWHQLGLCVFSGALRNRKATPDSQIAEESAAFNKSVWRATSHLLLPALVWLPCRVISCPHRCTSCLVSHPCHFYTHIHTHNLLQPLSFQKSPLSTSLTATGTTAMTPQHSLDSCVCVCVCGGEKEEEKKGG